MNPIQHNSKRFQRGVTLVEIMVVVALVAVLVSSVAVGTGAFGATNQRAAATLVVLGVRTGLAHANTTGLPARLVFDLDHQTLWLEESYSRMLRRKSDEADPTAGAAPVTEAEEAAAEDAERILEGPREPPPRFSMVREFGGAVGDGVLAQGRTLGTDVAFTSVQTDHDEEPRVEGRAYLYMWPGGETERAVVGLKRRGDDEGLSVVVQALSGRAKIHRGTISLEDEVDFGERDE